MTFPLTIKLKSNIRPGENSKIMKRLKEDNEEMENVFPIQNVNDILLNKKTI